MTLIGIPENGQVGKFETPTPPTTPKVCETPNQQNPIARQLSRASSLLSYMTSSSSFSEADLIAARNIRGNVNTIEMVRDQILNYASKIEDYNQDEDDGDNNQEFYHEDILHIQESNYAIKRFIVRIRATDDLDNIVKKTTNEIIRNLKWRKEIKLNERREETFPAIFFKAGLIGYGEEKTDITGAPTGRKMIYMNTKVYRRQPELTSHFHSFGTAIFDRVDKDLIKNSKGDHVRDKSLSLFIDLSDISLANADVNFLRHFINLLVYEYPLILNKCYLYEIPWYLKAVVSVTMSLLPKKFTRVVEVLDKKSAIDKLGASFVPIPAGGNLDTSITPPDNCPSIEEFADKYQIPMKVIEKAMRDYNVA